jgi:parvulin-like peptidyl-prolyl isomerase
MILKQPYPVRPRLDDVDDMIPFLTRKLSDTLEVREAQARGLHKHPNIIDMVEKIRQRRTTQVMYNQYITKNTQVPEDTLRAHFEAHREEYVLEAGHTASKILAGSKAEADSILERLEMGESFEEIARARSIDPFSAPKGGDLGFYPVGKDTEFDQFFAEMEVGEIRYFRSLEGHLILWLREKRERSVPTFEQARQSVSTSLLPRFKDRALRDWISETRQRYGVTTDESVLRQIELGS